MHIFEYMHTYIDPYVDNCDDDGISISLHVSLIIFHICAYLWNIYINGWTFYGIPERNLGNVYGISVDDHMIDIGILNIYIYICIYLISL